MVARVSGLVVRLPLTATTVAKRRDIAAGTRHAVADLSYAEGWSECSCGERLVADESIVWTDGRHDDLAQRMNDHIEAGNGRRGRIW